MSSSFPPSLLSLLHSSMKQIREQVKKEDVNVKEGFTHSSQKDAAKGFGGKYGVQADRKDKVST